MAIMRKSKMFPLLALGAAVFINCAGPEKRTDPPAGGAQEAEAAEPSMHKICKGPDYRTNPVSGNSGLCMMGGQLGGNVDCEEGTKVPPSPGHPCYGLEVDGLVICAIQRKLVDLRCEEGWEGYRYVFTSKTLNELPNDAMTIRGTLQ